jgi:predicted transcriptional regulator
MFADQDVCCVSQLALQAEGFGKTLPSVLRALVAAGFVSRQADTAPTPRRRGSPPHTYRLRLPEMAQ